MALFEQVGNYVKVRTTTLPETLNQEDYERIHISEFSCPSKGAQTIAFMDGSRTVLVISGNAEAQSYYADTMAALITAADAFIATLEETGGGGVGGATNLAVANRTGTTLTVTSDTGSDAVIPEASATEAGLLKATDKVKLNNTSGTNTGDQDLSGLLPKSGAAAGAVDQAQQLDNGWSADVAGFNVRGSSSGISITNTGTGKGAQLNNDGSVSAVDNIFSTFSKLHPDGSVETTAVLNSVVGNVKRCFAKVNLTAEQIQTLDSDPVELIPAPGVGKLIRLIDVCAFLDFNTTPYDPVSLLFYTGIGYQKKIVGLLDIGVDSYMAGFIDPADLTYSVLLVPNTSLKVSNDAAAGSAGDSPISFYITYEIITL